MSANSRFEVESVTYRFVRDESVRYKIELIQK